VANAEALKSFLQGRRLAMRGLDKDTAWVERKANEMLRLFRKTLGST
jgi:hypothetical protein